MTISSETRKAGPFNGNGVTTSFPFVFKTFAKSDVKVIFTDADEIETILVLDSDYTVTLNVDQNANPGGSISYSTLATGQKLTVLGAVEYTQETDVQNQGGFYPEVIENAFDKITMLVQQVKEISDRAVVVPASSSVTSENYLDTINTYKVEAAASASAASTSASNASASEVNADASEASALAYSDLAQKWAEEAEDVPVETGKFSAKHWATKAEGIAGDKLPIAGGSLTGLLNLADEVAVASASTINITTADSNNIEITGTTTITAVTMPEGAVIKARASGAFQLTNSSSLIVQGGANYTTTVNDILTFTKDGAGNVHVEINKIDGKSVVFDTLRNYIDGLIISTLGSSSTITVSKGAASDSANDYLIKLTSSISKTTSSWAVGDGNGGLDTGTIENNTWYHFYQIRNPTTGAVDITFSKDASQPTLPSGYTQYRQIGSWRTNSSDQWEAWYQIEDTVYFKTPDITASNTTLGTTKTLIAAMVPLGIKTRAIMQLVVLNGDTRLVRLYSDYDTDAAVTADNATTLNSSASSRNSSIKQILTNTSSQVAWRADTSTAGSYLQTLGFIHPRGAY